MKEKIEFQGKQIHYKDEGKGFPVVFIHGFLESMSIWDHFALELSKTNRVVRIDLPGFGKTPVIQDTHPMELMAAVVKTVLDKIECGPCVMVGHSLGGYITLSFARQYPEALKGFVLFHSHASADTQEAKENRRRTVNIIKLNRSGFINQFIPDLFSETNISKYSEEIKRMQDEAAQILPEGVIAALEGMKMREARLDLLLETPLPVLFIAGKDDSRIPSQNIMAQAILPEHSEVLILANVGHMGFIEARDKTMAVIKGFVDRIM